MKEITGDKAGDRDTVTGLAARTTYGASGGTLPRPGTERSPCDLLVQGCISHEFPQQPLQAAETHSSSSPAFKVSFNNYYFLFGSTRV
jgi:hypothetical protein